jgi:hypothetical protein
MSDAPAMVEVLAAALARELVAARAPLALRPEIAAEMLSISLDTFTRHVAPDVRFVPVGRIRLYPVSEIVKWLEREARRELGGG